MFNLVHSDTVPADAVPPRHGVNHLLPSATPGAAQYTRLLHGCGGADQLKLLKASSPEHARVARAGAIISEASGLETAEWAFHVVDSDEINAFVVPGGKVFVNRGMIEFCKTEDELAVILTHEVGHVIARHTAERISMQRFPSVLKVAYYVLSFGGLVPAETLGEFFAWLHLYVELALNF